MSDTDLTKLTMVYNERSKRYCIKTTDGSLIQFPSEEEILKIWRTIFSASEFAIMSCIDVPVGGFAAVVGHTTRKERQRFCEAIAHACNLMPTD